jgi:hypothetical protein
VAIVVAVAALAVAITVWSTRAPGVAETGVRPVLATSFEGPSPWGFGSTVGDVTTTARWSHTGRRSLLATATVGAPAYVSASLPALSMLWGRFWLRVQHRPASGATVVMAVTGTQAGMFLKLQADGRLALVARGGAVIGRSAAPLASGRWYLIGWTWPRPLVRVTSPAGIELARLAGARQTGAARTLKLGLADRTASRRAVEIDSVEVWPG